MTISADKKMSWVIWIEVHDHISVFASCNDKSFFIRETRDATEGTLHIIAIKRAVLSAQIIQAMRSPEALPAIWHSCSAIENLRHF
jgi:hypothetical protein